MKLIPLKSRSKKQPKVALFTMVDDEDYDFLMQRRWRPDVRPHTTYAISGGAYNTIYMHRLLLGLEDEKLFGDHRDLNGLNNQKENLRVATKRQNRCNKKSAKNSTSEYLGVCLHKPSGRWRASITFNYKQIHLGYFDLEVDAAKAYNEAAIKYHGEFANLNKIEECSQ